MSWNHSRSSRSRRRFGSYPGCVVILVVVGVGVALAPKPVIAQRTDELCGEFNPVPGETDNSIKDCTDGLLDAQLDLINAADRFMDSMQQVSALSFSRDPNEVQSDLSERIRLLKGQHGRAQGANDDTEDDEYNELIEQADRQTGGKCRFVELEEYATADPADVLDFLPVGLDAPGSKFSDGECNAFSAIDMNTGRMVKVHERANGLCERLCEDKKVPNGQARKINRKQRLADRLTDSIDATANAADRFDEATDTMLRMAALSPRIDVPASSIGYGAAELETMLAGTAGVCDPIFEIPIPVPIDLVATGVLTGLIGVGKIATEVLDAAKDGAKQVCNQDVAGFNVSTGCMPFVIAFHISNGITELLEVARDAIEIGADVLSNFQTDAILACVKSIKEGQDVLQMDLAAALIQLGNAGAALGRVETELGALKQMIKDNHDLLLTPQGRRDLFNKRRQPVVNPVVNSARPWYMLW